ncbi:MAG: ATP-binding protein [Bryobacteraceae bacterium]|jgi:signal transduction histidine kinase
MTFRTRLLLVTSLTVAGAVALASGAISVWTRRTFERLDQERQQSVLTQFQRDLAARGTALAARVESAAESPIALRAAIEAARPAPDESLLVNSAAELAEAEGLDFADLVQADLTIISSAHWPARFGYQDDWLGAPQDPTAAEPFLTRIPSPEGSTLALAVVRLIHVGGKPLYVAGARQLDRELLASLGTAPGTRILLWNSPRDVLGAAGPIASPGRLQPLVDQAARTRAPAAGVVQWGAGRDTAEALRVLPLWRAGTLIGAFIVGTPLRAQIQLQRSILWTGLLVGFCGIVFGLLIGLWTTERITRPVKRLAAGARAVAAGDLAVRVPVTSRDEIGALAASFNRMTEQLLEQRERTLQAERVAAWRELARRLAHELKNPLFPLQITVENIRAARHLSAAEFDEVFEESTKTLLAELANLRTIVGRFSDFAKMPVPQLEPVDLNDVVHGALRLFEGQLQSAGGPPVALEKDLAPEPLPVLADREQLGRAFKNLILNALDAMPAGGTLHVTTAPHPDGAVVRIADTGQGLTSEECARLFTPYYTTKHHGTGLGLAIVQSVVSDHHGRISVTSTPGQGACFTIVLPRPEESTR